MQRYDVQNVEIQTDFEKAFRFIADARNLPVWTNAFKSVAGQRAVMETPHGAVEAELTVDASKEQGTIDWIMNFPDGSSAKAYSRLIGNGRRTIYSFVLTAPPVQLEELEGALAAQSEILREELQKLKSLLETS